jgi:predicted transposase YdaD
MDGHKTLDDTLWDIAQSCVPEARDSDEYKKETAKQNANWETLKTTLTKDQFAVLLKYEAQNNDLLSMEEDLVYRKIFFYGLAQGMEIGRRGKNERIPVFTKS